MWQAELGTGSFLDLDQYLRHRKKMTPSIGSKHEKGNLGIRRAVPLSVRSELSIPSRAEGEKGLKDWENWNTYVGGRSVGAF